MVFKHFLCLLKGLFVEFVVWVADIKRDCFGEITYGDIGFIECKAVHASVVENARGIVMVFKMD